MKEIADRIREVRGRIAWACGRARRDPGEVVLLAVTKGVPAEIVAEAYRAGLRTFGENYLQEARVKMAALPTDADWHFIGRLQRNKVRDAVGMFSAIHSVDGVALAGEVGRRARMKGCLQKVFLQVNVAGEATKSGCRAEEAVSVATAVSGIEGLDLRGLMCIPPPSGTPEGSRAHFRRLRLLRDGAAGAMGREPGSLGLSMGMTADFEVAVEEGATVVRIGTALFGPRK